MHWCESKLRFSPRIHLSDGSLATCPVWTAVRCRLYQEKYAEWIDDGRDRGIPERFVEASLNSIRRTPALDVVAEFIKDLARRGRALILLGPHGCGKTWSVSAAVHAWPAPRATEGDPFYITVSKFVRDLMRWDRRSGRAHPLDVCIASSFLALDDLGVGHITKGSFAAHSLEELLHERHAAELPTIITSNWTAGELRQNLSRRTYDRFREWGRVVELEGPSLRESE